MAYAHLCLCDIDQNDVQEVPTDGYMSKHAKKKKIKKINHKPVMRNVGWSYRDYYLVHCI